MEQHSREILKSLVEMAKADGQISAEEKDLLVKVFIESGAAAAETANFDELIKEFDAEEADLKGLEDEQRLNVMRALLIMSFMDGKLSFKEFIQIEKRQKELSITDDQMEVLRLEADAAAEAIKQGKD